MIPVKFRYHPPCVEGEALKGHANRIMLILDNMMRYGKLNQHIIKFTPYDGAMIVARNVFGMRTVDVYTGGSFPTVKQSYQLCICNCNFSVGWVLEVPEATINGAQLYTVMACNNDGTAYIPYYNVLAADFSPYEVAQKTLMIPYNDMAYLCCTDKRTAPKGCRPMISVEPVDSGEWRTTYRILPYCALLIPTLVNPGEWNHHG